MNKTRKTLRSLAVVGVVGGLASLGSFSAFSGQAENPSNELKAGTVSLLDNDVGGSLYQLLNSKPGLTKEACIRVSYGGTLDADMKIYTAGAIAALGEHVTVKVEPGSQSSPSFPSCTGFNADAGGAIFDDKLSNFPTSYDTGVSDYPGSATKWANGDAVVYRVTTTLAAGIPDTLQGASTGSHALRFEARNQ